MFGSGGGTAEWGVGHSNENMGSYRVWIGGGERLCQGTAPAAATDTTGTAANYSYQRSTSKYVGGASLCSDDEPALASAFRRVTGGRDKEDKLQPKLHSSNVQLIVNSIRKQLLLQEPPSSQIGPTLLPSKDELRQKRTRAISLKVMDSQCTHTHLKRMKLQAKHESKFLDKHIRRARQLTSDAQSKRHKELLKAV